MPKKKTQKASKEHYCERLTATGQPCRQFALLKRDHCGKHQWAPRYDGNAKSLNEIKERELRTVEDVRSFFQEVLFVVKNGGDPEQRHKGLVEIGKQMIAAIKERDANTDEKHQKALEVAKAQQILIQNLTIDDAKQILIDRSLMVLEQRMEIHDAEVTAVQSIGIQEPFGIGIEDQGETI